MKLNKYVEEITEDGIKKMLLDKMKLNQILWSEIDRLKKENKRLRIKLIKEIKNEISN